MREKAKILCMMALCLAMLAASGCAFGTRNVVLVYPPEEAASPGPEEAEAAVPVADAQQTVILVKFADPRPDGALIGHVRNGFGMKTAAVKAKNSISDWMTGAMEHELKKAGYNVVLADSPGPGAAELTLEGEVVKVYTTAMFTYEGDVAFSARVSRGGEELLRKFYTGTGSAGLNLAATASGFGTTVTRCLSDALSEFMHDFNAVASAEKAE